MLSLMTLAGSPFEIGRSLGRFGARIAHDYLVSSRDWASVIAWRGTDAARTMTGLVQTRFPLIWEEITGLASGLELPLDEVFLWNCRGDVWAMARDGCTTVQLPLPSGIRIAHNEDGDPGFAGYCGIAEIAVANGARFASFVYPASIPGHTFSVTDAGLALTVNNLRSRDVTVGVPRMVLTRALLDQTSLADAVSLLRTAPRAGGYHLSLAQQGCADLLSIEFNAAGVSAQVIHTPAVHANHAIHDLMREFPQVITTSSLHRQRRGEALLAAAQTGGPIDPLAILADRDDAEFPILREADDDSDSENTLASADIHVKSDRIDWQIYERPGQAARFWLVNGRIVSSPP